MEGKKDPKQDRGGGGENRLAPYGIDAKQLLAERLVIAPNTHVRLSAADAKRGSPGLVELRPKDIDDVKRWIGVRDDVGARRACACALPAEVPSAASPAAFRKLPASARKAVRDMAFEYVHGDSSRVAAYKNLINHLLDGALIHGIFLREDIDIYNGAVLEVGGDIKVLYARNIRIWRGGQLKINGGVKIDCVSIVGDLTLTIPKEIAGIRPVIGNIIEVAHG